MAKVKSAKPQFQIQVTNRLTGEVITWQSVGISMSFSARRELGCKEEMMTETELVFVSPKAPMSTMLKAKKKKVKNGSK